jgi:repressor LexA
MREKLSGVQEQILTTIDQYVARHGLPPTIRAIGRAVNIGSTSHIDHHLTMLEKKGYIVRERNTSRGIRLKRDPGLPLLGEIAAGSPLDVLDTDDPDTIDLGPHAGSEGEYALRVRGSSMIDQNIFDGDYVLVQPCRTVDKGEIVVAVHTSANGGRGAATVKAFYRERGRVRLQPANPDVAPILVSAREWDREWEVQGRVTGVYRDLRKPRGSAPYTA